MTFRPFRPFRPTIRLRLTVWYAGMFFVGGALLLAAAYVIVTDRLHDYAGRVATRVQEASGARDDPPPAAVVLPAPEEATRLRAEAEAAEQAAQRRAIAGRFVGVLGALTIGSVVTGGWVAGRALRPVAQITRTARSVTDGRLSERIGLEGPEDELKELADTFDDMLSRLDASFASERQFVANASHELRTPLTRLRTAVDVAADDPAVPVTPASRELLAVVREAVEHSDALIQRLFVLARSDRGIDATERVDLSDVAAAALSALAGLPTEMTVHRDLRPAVVVGDRLLLEQLVANLTDNALRYGASWARVRTATESGAGAAVLVVENDGPTIPAPLAERLAQPFRRGEGRARTSGMGLGLSIARSVALAHHGDLTLHPHRGGGLVVTVRLPHRSAVVFSTRAGGPGRRGQKG